MLEASLNERLRELNPQHALNDELASDRSIEALERIGATFVFGRTDKLVIPDFELSLGPSSPDFDLAK